MQSLLRAGSTNGWDLVIEEDVTSCNGYARTIRADDDRSTAGDETLGCRDSFSLVRFIVSFDKSDLICLTVDLNSRIDDVGIPYALDFLVSTTTVFTVKRLEHTNDHFLYSVLSFATSTSEDNRAQKKHGQQNKSQFLHTSLSITIDSSLFVQQASDTTKM